MRKTEKNGVLFADQWNNLDNRKAHYTSTGPEIWRDTGGKIDGFICSVGTGGTLAGTSTYLREQKHDIAIGCADPRGAAMYHLFKDGKPTVTEGGSITEGIGLARITPIIEDIKVDHSYLIPDEEAVPIIFDLLEHEGCALAARRASTSRARSGSRRILAKARPSSPCCAITAPATSPSCSIRNSCARKICRCRTWLTHKTEIKPPFV